MKIIATDLDIADASRLAQTVRLAAVHFSSVQARTLGGGQVGGELGWSLTPLAISWAFGDGQLRVVVPITVHILQSDKAILAQVTVLLRLDYEGMPTDEVESAIASFAGISGFMHAWPYARAEIQHLTTKIELPPLLLPSVVSGQVTQLVASVSRLPDAAANELPAKAPSRSTPKRKRVSKPRTKR